jgi:hypothetical protein
LDRKKLKILLVEPEFPIPPKSKNHKNFLPIGLLKLATYYKNKGDIVQLIRGNLPKERLPFDPDQIFVTSLFTYWRKYVKQSVEHYRNLFPEAKICVGGIYASLMPEDCKEYTCCDEVHIGIHKEAEQIVPDYSLVSNPHNLGFQIIHASRGCIRNCEFCGVRQIEPEFIFKKSIKEEICSGKLVFYDNNILANPYIINILQEIADFKYRGKNVLCESQCGFDGRLLTPEIAKMIKKARFQNVRIAWDDPYSDYKEIEKQIGMLTEAGYERSDIFIFMIHNWEIDFNEMERKREKCKQWGVQIADCRYRPMDQTYDDYNPLKKQTITDYYIHPKWTDELVKRFRRNVRRQNICVRMGFESYDGKKEREGERQRNIRKKLALSLRNLGYDITRVRQVKKIKTGWSIYCRTPTKKLKVEVSNSFQIRQIKGMKEE